MKFQTWVPVPPSPFPIDYSSKTVLLGSCFAENIGEKFRYFKLENAVNPFGIIFNPVSLEKIIRRSIAHQKFSESDIFFHNDLWHCFEVHSELSNPDKYAFLNSLNAVLEVTNQQITALTHCIITLGTAWVYRDLKSNEIVANCHKVPQKQFAKELLSVAQIQESLQRIISLVSSVNPNCNLVFTVSPVRHIKDGFVENQRSKAHLITALHSQLQTEHSKLNTVYFPSYEIVMDELRDYRFYAQDMLHPNPTAIDYIWERFSEAYFSAETQKIMGQVAAIQKDLQHRPFNPNSESHTKFLQNLNQKISKLEARYPTLKF